MLARLRRDPVGLVFVTLLAIIVLLMFWRVAHVLLVAFTGLLLGVFLNTLTGAIERHTPLGRRLSLAVVSLSLGAVFVGVTLLIAPQLGRQLGKVDMHLSHPLERAESRLAQSELGRLVLQHAPLLRPRSDSYRAPNSLPPSNADGAEEEEVGDTPLTNLAEQNSSASQQFGSLLHALIKVIGAFADLFFILFLGGFLAAAPASYRRGVTRLFPKDQRERADEVLRDVYRTLQGWLLGKLISMVIVGTLTGLGLYLLDMPLVLSLALFAFLLEFIPIVGPWIASIPALLLAFSEGPTMVFWVALLYLVVQLLEGNVIFPIAEAKTVHLPPAITLIAVFVGGALFGLLGFLVATPLTAVMYVLVKTLYVQDTLGYDVALENQE